MGSGSREMKIGQNFRGVGYCGVGARCGQGRLSTTVYNCALPKLPLVVGAMTAHQPSTVSVDSVLSAQNASI